MRVAVVGAGLSGLSAAIELSKSCETVVFERKSYVGGTVATYPTLADPVERYYHHCFLGDDALLALLDELNLRSALRWRLAGVGYMHAGRVYPMNTPLEILRFPTLSLRDILRIAAFVLTARRATPEPLDDVACIPYLVERVGERAYHAFFAPLLERKFGKRADEVSAAWLLTRIALRSHRTLRGERLGYLDGGFGRLLDEMVRCIRSRGGVIRTSSPVEHISPVDGGVELSVGDRRERFDAVVCTSPSLLRTLGIGTSISYQGSVCVLVALKRRLLNGIYWLNMDEDAPFGAMIEHTNLIPKERYGHHLVYLTSYHEHDEPEMTLQEHEIAERYVEALRSLFPLGREDVLWSRVQRDAFTSPVYDVGYLRKVVPYSTPVEGVYAAGVFSPHNYPERSMNGSIAAGKMAAHTLLREQAP
ncbi:NAD(P)/FAD-dependent oxidoreductase [Methermicoccus shengliensis]|uniref:NAD(P)/FAD-dependent oxidoreductase n=1 Tax=Methermicoccus shengliensis TaxID=660064 RepID=A0A832RYN8_9EURY|nr:NAD(P)/FAD-dependent oxidoreductase [Methermicoccus shengliensis]KUK05267.1 MAG: Amine oxidase [Euryarchaeota archaeon 55_53]KUK30318.1 MAG: Amine oxidase [Methanosarcinales archeaon 56_1174]MDI3487854.1 hypothetical protein [Methanosarcinales archaeon]MDN5294499.1 hypothetical protein [Methanosarcinales archaeon]HIH69771.1 NAD(P)/FAD-dependent oxidoreductase [Methermicoccus shengliensis]